MAEPGAIRHPELGDVIASERFSDHLEKHTSIGDRWLSGMTVTWTGLTLHVAIGQGDIRGRLIDFQSQVNETLTPSTTNSVYFTRDKNILVSPADTIPGSDVVKIWEVTTDGSTVTGTVDFRDRTVNIGDDLLVDNLESRGAVAGEFLDLESAEPEVAWTDISVGGASFKVINRNGKLQLTDLSGATIYVDDLSAISAAPQNNVLDLLATPPGGPTTGDRYIVIATATGAWVGQEDDIAEWNGSAWDFTTPSEGWRTWDEDSNRLYFYTGAAWAQLGTDAATAGELVIRNNAGKSSFVQGTAQGQTLTAGYAPWLRTEKTADFTADSWAAHYHCNHATPATQLVATLPLTPAENMFVFLTAGDNTGGLRVKENATDQSPIHFSGSESTGDGTGFIELEVRQSVLLSYEDGKWMAVGGGGAGGITWNEVSGTSQTMEADNGYVADNAALCTLTLPVDPGFGETVEVGSENAGGWKIAQNTGDQIIFSEGGVGIGRTTIGVAGSVESTDANDWIQLVCVDSAAGGSEWRVRNQRGSVLVT